MTYTCTHIDWAWVYIAMAYKPLIYPTYTSNITQVEQVVDVFRDISQASLEATVELVKEDRVNILIDLMGFSSSGRPALFELKPVPIPIHYLNILKKLIILHNKILSDSN